MKGYESLSSGQAVGVRPMSDLDFKMMSKETASRSEAVSKAIEAVTVLLTRIMTVDACIDIMRRRDPFAKIDRPMSNLSRLCAEMTAECLKVYEFCVADNVLAIQTSDKDESNPEDLEDGVDVAADQIQPYGK